MDGQDGRDDSMDGTKENKHRWTTKEAGECVHRIDDESDVKQTKQKDVRWTTQIHDVKQTKKDV